MELFKATRQWASRPEDERFETPQALYNATKGYSDTSHAETVDPKTLRVVAASGGDLRLTGLPGTDAPARLSNWGFNQLAQRVGAPAPYLRGLPAPLAAQNLNHGLDVRSADEKSAVILVADGRVPLVRSVTSDIYSRIWNYEIAERLMLLPEGWRVPPARPAFENQAGTRPATAEDVLRAGEHGLSINVGDSIAPAGLYASDHDMFAFMVNEDVRIDDGSDAGLSRGFFVWNSEVGASSFGVCRFLYKSVCGNHIVWGAKEVIEFRMPHIGAAPMKAFSKLEGLLVEYSNESASDEEAQIRVAKKLLLGNDKESVLDKVFGFRINGLTKKTIDAAYDVAQTAEVYGDPRSAWGLANGLTQYSQTIPYADSRLAIDRAAGKLLQAVN